MQRLIGTSPGLTSKLLLDQNLSFKVSQLSYLPVKVGEGKSLPPSHLRAQGLKGLPGLAFDWRAPPYRQALEPLEERGNRLSKHYGKSPLPPRVLSLESKMW